MSTQLKFTRTTDMFGTTITLSNKDKSFSEVIATNLDFDPIKKMSKTLKDGYLFRSPGISTNDWTDTLKSIKNIEGEFRITAQVEQEKNKKPTITALIRFKEKSDCAIFAWSNLEVWQKWSDELEAEAQKEAKEYKKALKNPQKVKINKDGTVTVKATVTTLGK